MQVALAWLLQRSPNILLIPHVICQASSENLNAAALQIPSEMIVILIRSEAAPRCDSENDRERTNR